MNPERPTWDDLRNRLEAVSGLPASIASMHARWGNRPGTCGQCLFCVRVEGDRQIRPFKCVHYGITNSAATDWRSSWPACGSYVARPKVTPDSLAQCDAEGHVWTAEIDVRRRLLGNQHRERVRICQRCGRIEGGATW
jgi:hypothetical protein